MSKHKSPIPYALIRGSSRERILPREVDVRILRVRGGRVDDVSAGIESVNWSDGDSGAADPGTGISMGGNLVGRRVDPLDPHSGPVSGGDQIMIQYADALADGDWRTEITLTVSSSQDEDEPKTGVENLQVADPFAAYDRAQATFVYRKDKNHRNSGWRMDTIIMDACHRMGAPYDPKGIVKGHVPFPSKWISDGMTGGSKDHRSTLAAFIAKTKGYEETNSRRNLLVDVVNGRLTVTERGAGRRALVLDTSAQELQITSSRASLMGSGGPPVTAVEGWGYIGKGKHAKKRTYRAEAKVAISRFGYVLSVEHFKHVTSEADLRDKSKRSLAKHLRVTRTADVTIPGTPGLRIDDAVVLAPSGTRPGIPDYQTGFHPDEFGDPYGETFIVSRNHTIENGVWTTQLQLGERDRWLDYRRALAERKAGYPRRHKSPSKHHAVKTG